MAGLNNLQGRQHAGSVRAIADGEYRICLHDSENTDFRMEFTLTTRAETRQVLTDEEN